MRLTDLRLTDGEIPLIDGGQGHDLGVLGPAAAAALLGALAVLAGLAIGGLSLLAVSV
jgi:hypothetical protein